MAITVTSGDLLATEVGRAGVKWADERGVQGGTFRGSDNVISGTWHLNASGTIVYEYPNGAGDGSIVTATRP